MTLNTILKKEKRKRLTMDLSSNVTKLVFSVLAGLPDWPRWSSGGLVLQRWCSANLAELIFQTD